MVFLSPLGLLWLVSIPVLVWLWRLNATHRQTSVPSLIPFEHLLRRQARRRTRVVVNLLFWLQLAALIGLTLALAQPVLLRHPAKLTLIILDTSASMGARVRGTSAFEQARRKILARIRAKAPTEQLFVMTSAPVTALTPTPTSDAATLTRLVQDLRVSHLGGNLATATRIGRAVLATEPDETLVVTDEAAPNEERVRWVSVGQPLPNLALIRLDTQGPLCTPADARVVATIQNFSDEPSTLTLEAAQDGRRLAELRAELAPRARQAFSLALPEGTSGWVEIRLVSSRDALEVDNRAWVQLTQHASIPIVVRSERLSFIRTISTWLQACPALAWTQDAPPSTGPYLLVTDREERAASSAAATLLFLPPPAPAPVLSHWVASFDHPISSYLAPVDVVATSLNLSPGQAVSGHPVIYGLVQGRKVPIVVADEREGRRTVSMLLDPAGSEDATPVVLAFFNSLRWLMGHLDVTTTGETLTIKGLAAGTVNVRRPDGSRDRVEAEQEGLRYEATMFAGTYRFTQGTHQVSVAVNFFDPLESNILDHPSTWGGAPVSLAAANPRRTAPPLSNVLLWLLLVLVLTEWWLYCVKSQTLVHRPLTTDHKRQTAART